MNERQIDLAHTVALGSIDDEDHQAVQELLDSEDPARRAEFITEVHLTREALSALAAATAVQPPAALRGGGGRARRSGGAGRGGGGGWTGGAPRGGWWVRGPPPPRARGRRGPGGQPGTTRP
ncbi:RskA family anti-sigma factor [Nocardia cyriacigeorgica]|uniref:RskA family anti-sigma factor n=1 Tax=Nocardia cyriacigeorgica TaxID=135487 RepID=UPI003D770FEC